MSNIRTVKEVQEIIDQKRRELADIFERLDQFCNFLQQCGLGSDKYRTNKEN